VDSHGGRAQDDGVRFIVGRAVDMLSAEEHAAKRAHVEAIAEKLGTGEELAGKYLTGSKAVDQQNDMTYDPNADIVVEYARPNYNVDDDDDEAFQESIRRTTDARILYMAFVRCRALVKNTPVSAESIDAKVIFRGIHCTLKTLLASDLFNDYASVPFKTMVLTGVLETYGEWHVLRANDLAKNVNHVDRSEEFFRLHAPDVVIDCVTTYRRLVRDVKTDNLHALLGELSRLVGRICNRPHETERVFVDTVPLRIYVDNTPLYRKFHYSVNKPIALASLHLMNVGDVRLYGSGRNPCTDKWRAKHESAYDTSRCAYPKPLLRDEAFLTKYRRITPGKICQFALEAFQIPLYFDAITTLVLKGVILATTVPECSVKVCWSNVFLTRSNKDRFSCKPLRFAALMRKSCHEQNRVFSTCGGDLMNLPRPFRKNACRVPSDAILKTRQTVWSYAAAAAADLNTDDDDDDDDDDEDEARRVNSMESLFMMGCINPIFGTLASTVASAQGSTHESEVVLNFEKIAPEDHLVGLTRSVDIRKLKVAGLTAPNTTVCEEGREKSRRKIQRLSRYYRYRQ
jgi:hypothetical protein